MTTIPAQIGPYRVLRKLGQGGMGVVLEVADPDVPRTLALKLVLEEKADAVGVERFWREAAALGRVKHRGVVGIHKVGQVPEGTYLVMEKVEGQALDDLIAEGPLEPERAARIVRELADALEAVHAAGILHRDVKPGNVILRADDVPVLLDFGLVREAGAEKLTRTGTSLGTLAYMAPEQVGGASTSTLGPPVDVWALGAVLFELLAGQRPFDGGAAVLVGQILNAPAPPPSSLQKRVPRALDAVCLMALAKRPADRYATAGALRDDLQRFLSGELPLAAVRAGQRRVLGRLAATAAVVLAVAVALVLVRRARAPSDEPARAGPVDRTAPVLTLSEPRSQTTTWSHELVFEGRVSERSSVVALTATVSPLVTTVAAGQVPAPFTTRVPTDAPFRLTVAIPPGTSLVEVAAQDEAGNRGVASRTVTRVVVPEWFVRLPDERRPPLPLPAGLEFGVDPGEYVHPRDGSVLCWVPPGTFVMGRDDARQPDERPAHEVTLTRGYFLGKYELTWGLFRAFCAAVGRRPPTPLFACDDTHPVHRLTFDDALAYCAWAGLRLPTEAEWEHAARGTDGRRFPWGEEADPDRLEAVTPDARATCPVGSFPEGAGPYGHLDLAGNVYEWVADRYGETAYPPRPQVDPTGPTSGESRVVRGGAWHCTLLFCEGSHRFWFDPHDPAGCLNGDIGLRVCLSP